MSPIDENETQNDLLVLKEYGQRVRRLIVGLTVSFGGLGVLAIIVCTQLFGHIIGTGGRDLGFAAVIFAPFFVCVLFGWLTYRAILLARSEVWLRSLAKKHRVDPSEVLNAPSVLGAEPIAQETVRRWVLAIFLGIGTALFLYICLVVYG